MTDPITAIQCEPLSPWSAALLRLMQQASAFAVPRGLPRLGWVSRRAILGRGVKTIPYRNRFRMCCNTDLYPSVMFGYGINNRYIDRVLAMILRPHDVFFDIGANVGMISLLACSSPRVQNTITAHCFEPDPNAFAWLTANRAHNTFDMTLNECAVGAAKGHANLTISSYAGWSTLAPEPEAGFSFLTKAGQKVVDVVAIDDYCEKHQLAPAVMKIDVEGFETEVLKGAAKTLTTVKPKLIVEINPTRLTAAGSSAEELGKTFEQLGYKIFHSVVPKTPLAESRLTWRGLPAALPTDVAPGKTIDVLALHEETLAAS